MSYEELVVEPLPVISQILNHVGLRHQDGLIDFHNKARHVATASFAQVRQPLYQSSRTAWRSYDDKLDAFFAAYDASSVRGR